MAIEFMSAVAFLGGAIITTILSSKVTSKGARQQLEILQRGQQAQGTIIRVWRPPLAGSFPRVYFEFEPQGSDRAVQSCHIDRRSLSEPSASLPPVGAKVGIRYLPENPTNAVIAKLVSRFGH